jgi:hypothetical protein
VPPRPSPHAYRLFFKTGRSPKTGLSLKPEVFPKTSLSDSLTLVLQMPRSTGDASTGTPEDARHEEATGNAAGGRPGADDASTANTGTGDASAKAGTAASSGGHGPSAFESGTRARAFFQAFPSFQVPPQAIALRAGLVGLFALAYFGALRPARTWITANALGPALAQISACADRPQGGTRPRRDPAPRSPSQQELPQQEPLQQKLLRVVVGDRVVQIERLSSEQPRQSAGQIRTESPGPEGARPETRTWTTVAAGKVPIGGYFALGAALMILASPGRWLPGWWLWKGLGTLAFFQLSLSFLIFGGMAAGLAGGGSAAFSLSRLLNGAFFQGASFGLAILVLRSARSE